MTEIVHACPLGGSGLMPCCGRTPFEVGPLARISENPEAVTCPGADAAPAAHAGPCGQHCNHKADTAPEPVPELRELVAAAIYERNNPGRRWADAHPDDRLAYGGDADAVLAVPAIRALAETRDALRVTEGDRDAAEAELHRLREESPWLRATAEDLAEANAAIERVRALHRPVQYRGRPICVECSGYGGSTCDNGPQPHPCPTITALDPQEPS